MSEVPQSSLELRDHDLIGRLAPAMVRTMERRQREGDSSELRDRSIQLRSEFGKQYVARLQQVPAAERADFANEFEAALRKTWSEVAAAEFGSNVPQSAEAAYRRLLTACTVEAVREASPPAQQSVEAPVAGVRHDVQSTLSIPPRKLPGGVARPEGQTEVLNAADKHAVEMNIKDFAARIVNVAFTSEADNAVETNVLLHERARALRAMIEEVPVGRQRDQRKAAIMAYSMQIWLPLANEYAKNSSVSSRKLQMLDGYLPSLWRLV
jgi:hypothetical protein